MLLASGEMYDMRNSGNDNLQGEHGSHDQVQKAA